MALSLGQGRTYASRVAVGLVSCAVGNICFELEAVAQSHVPLFFVGMGFFVAGLCAMSYAFFANPIRVSALTSAPPIAFAAMVFNVLRPTVPFGLLGPVFAYAAVIAGLLLLAFSRQPEGLHPVWSWRCASAGAVLFTATSTLLGYSRFVSTVAHAKLIFMICYYLAQYLITMSVQGAEPRQLSKALGSVENFQSGQSFRVES